MSDPCVSSDLYFDLYEHAPIGYLTLAGNGEITSANLCAAGLLGVDRDSLIGARLARFVSPEAQRDWRRHLRSVRASGAQQTRDIRFRNGGGEPTVLRVQSVATGEAAAAVRGRLVRTALIDITELVRVSEELRQRNRTLETLVVERAAKIASIGRELEHEVAESRETKAALRNSEQRLRTVVGGAIDGIFILNSEGGIETVNPAAEELFGYRSDDFLGRNLMAQITPDDHNIDAAAFRIDASGIRQFTAQHRDGTLIPIELAVSHFRRGADRKAVVIVRDLTDQRRLLSSIDQTVLEQQQAIGRELHDGVAQLLTGIEMTATALQSRGDQPSPALVQSLLEQAREAQRQIRTVIRGVYRHTVRGADLEAALRELVVSLHTSYDLRGSFERSGQLRALDDQTATQIYYIAKEAVFNTIKHAHAREVKVDFRREKGSLILTVRDDGIGMPQQQENRGLGLRIMQHRATMIGASLLIESKESAGTTVRAVVPLSVGSSRARPGAAAARRRRSIQN